MRYLYVAFLIALIVLGAHSLELLFRVTGSDLSIYKKSGAGIVALYLMALILVGLFMKVAAPLSFGHFFRLYRANGARALRGFLTMFALGSAMVIGLFILLAIVGRLHWADDAAARFGPLLIAKFVGGILAACTLAMSEELLFRGFLFSYLRWNTSRAVTVSAVIVSSLVFATAHNIHAPLEWLTPEQFPLFFSLFLLGILLSVTYLVTGSIWCNIGLHAGLVAFGEAFLRLDVIHIDFSPWWMGGGADEIRMAPLVWLSFAVTTIIHIATRQRLDEQFAVEKPFVGMPLDGEGRLELAE